MGGDGLPLLLFGAALVFTAVAGSNDGGNLMGTLVASRVFSTRGAVLVLLSGVAAGPWVLGVAVAHTIVFSVIALPRLGPHVYLAAVAGALLTLCASWWRGIPTSTSLALVGALAGAGLGAEGARAVVWHQVWLVVGGMLVTPVVGALLGAGVWGLVRLALRNTGEHAAGGLRWFQLGAGLLQGLAYGANGAERSVGLLALAAAWRQPAGQAALAASHLPTPGWVIWAVVAATAAGMAVGGPRVAQRIAAGMYRVRSIDALSAQLAGSLAVVGAAVSGIPVSSGQATTSALLAAGASRRWSLPRWQVASEMATAWVVTLPVSLLIGAALGALGARP